MEKTLIVVLEEYIESVEKACEILLNGINQIESNIELRTKIDFLKYRQSNGKMEFEIDSISYRLHGAGCTAFNSDLYIDWDFGYRSRWCGIDPWKVANTLRRNESRYIQFYDGNLIKKLCDKFVNEGIMFMKHNQYYFEPTAVECFVPEFPKEYDELIIEYFDLVWCVPRNKNIDRFIRKSTRISNCINEHSDRYTLRFLLNGNEVYSVFYNDRCYPESSVKIMSDLILAQLK